MTQAPDWADEAETLSMLGAYSNGNCAPEISFALRTAYTMGRVEGLREAVEAISDAYDAWDREASAAKNKSHLNTWIMYGMKVAKEAVEHEIEREGRE